MNKLIGVLRLDCPWVFFRIIAHNTGASDKATIAEMIIDEAIAMENWR